MNDRPSKKSSHLLEWVVWSVLVATVLAIASAFIRSKVLESALTRPLDPIGEVPGFVLTNQLGAAFGLSNLSGQVWVADVIFSRCPVSCERMTQRLKQLQDEIPSRLPVRFISLTADPEFDSPDVLKKYAERHQIEAGGRWQFLTGLKRDVYALSVTGLKFSVLDNETRTIPEDLFIHSTQFVLVDKRGRIRGYFEGTEETDRKQLALAIRKLARER